MTQDSADMGGNGTPSQGELKRWLQRVDSETRHQWGEIRNLGSCVARVETKVDQLLERRTDGDIGAGLGDARVRFERMHGVWKFIGHALAVAVPAAMLTATVVIAWMEYLK